jgi:hypothetical protein
MDNNIYIYLYFYDRAIVCKPAYKVKLKKIKVKLKKNKSEAKKNKSEAKKK